MLPYPVPIITGLSKKSHEEGIMPDALIWPVVALVCIVTIGIVALFVFRPAFTRLIDRTSKAGKDGVTFERHQEGGEATSHFAVVR